MSNEKIQEMQKVLELQKKLYIEESTPSLEIRQDRLTRCVEMLKKYNENPSFRHCRTNPINHLGSALP